MQRISTEQDGIFKDGVPGVSRGTRVNAAWFNAVQEELCYLIEHCGITLDPTVNTQLYSALREALEGIFEDSLIVSSSQVAGKRVTIDSESIDINGVELKSALVNNVITLVVDEVVKMLKNLIVLGNLSVDGRVDVGGEFHALNSFFNDVTIDGIVNVAAFAEFASNVRILGLARIVALQADKARLRNVVSMTEARVEVNSSYGDNEYAITDANFSATIQRITCVVQTGRDPNRTRLVVITAEPVNGRAIQVVNKAFFSDGYVYVCAGDSSNVLGVLAPGVDRWFDANGNAWGFAENIIG